MHRGRFDALEIGAVEELAAVYETGFQRRLRLCLQFSSSPVPCCILFDIVSRQLCGAENATAEQTVKIVPLITCEIALGQYVCELVFGVNIFDWDFGGPN